MWQSSPLRRTGRRASWSWATRARRSAAFIRFRHLVDHRNRHLTLLELTPGGRRSRPVVHVELEPLTAGLPLPPSDVHTVATCGSPVAISSSPPAEGNTGPDRAEAGRGQPLAQSASPGGLRRGSGREPTIGPPRSRRLASTRRWRGSTHPPRRCANWKTPGSGRWQPRRSPPAGGRVVFFFLPSDRPGAPRAADCDPMRQ